MAKTEKAATAPVKSGGDEEKTGLASVMVRISAENAEYQKMHTSEGWFVAVGAPRAPELDKAIRLLLAKAVKRGCALFATEGGVRILKGANGKGGVCFIEKKSMLTGEEVFLFSTEKEAAEKAGLMVTRYAKSTYVNPKNKEGMSIFDTVFEKFSNNHGPMNFALHDWPGYKVEPIEKKPKAEKASKKEKVVKAATPTDKTPKKKETASEEALAKPPAAVKPAKVEKKVKAGKSETQAAVG